jgi:uncharacterized protein CbrC (UPF0167 family)
MLSLSTCPKCHQSIDAQAIECPYCRTVLKAYGHPGMTLHRAQGQEPLCLTCSYHEDDSCTFPKRPDAMDCTLYHDRTKPLVTTTPGYSTSFQIKTWLRRYRFGLLIAGLLFVSLVVTLLR